MLTITSTLMNENNIFQVFANGNLIDSGQSGQLIFDPNSVLTLFQNFTGAIDKIAIYDSILSNQEVTSVFENDLSSFVDPDLNTIVTSGLMNYYNFDDETGQDMVQSLNIDGVPRPGFSFSQDTPSGSGFSVKLDDVLQDGVEVKDIELNCISSFSSCFWLKIDSTNEYCRWGICNSFRLWLPP